MISLKSTKRQNILISGSLKCIRLGVLPIIIAFIPFSENAWSYENINAPINYDVSRETLLDKVYPSSNVADVCRSLLKTNHHTSSELPTNRSQRTAGKIAALGIILGVRFALEPKDTKTRSIKESSKRQITQIDTGASSAVSITAFRKCQKEYALNMIR